jgi:hypothetical protein
MEKKEPYLRVSCKSSLKRHLDRGTDESAFHNTKLPQAILPPLQKLSDPQQRGLSSAKSERCE